MTDQSPGTALVTGASRGIGRALATEFASEGHDVALVARSVDRLDDVATDLEAAHGVTAHPVAQDLTALDGPRAVYDRLADADVTVDILVNNAGVAGPYGPFHRTPLEDELDMLQLNVVALTHLTKLFVRDMSDRGRGRVLNVASTAAFNPGPLMSVYHGTKSYVLVFSEAIAEELRETGVSVTVLCPGKTDTDFLTHSGVSEPESGDDEAMDPRRVARVAYEGLMDGETLVFPDRRDQMMAAVTQALPRRLVRRVAMRREADRDRTYTESAAGETPAR